MYRFVSSNVGNIRIGCRSNRESYGYEDSQCDIFYATTASMINKLLAIIKTDVPTQKKVEGYIIIDEMHHKSSENTVILYLVEWMLKKGYNYRVIYMTATVPDKYKEVFASVRKIEIEVKSRFTLAMHYATDPDRGIDAPKQRIQKAIELAQEHSREHKRILIFVHGCDEAEDLAFELETRITTHLVKFVHGRQTFDERSLILTSSSDMIIVTTNCLESSTTVPNISLIIDTCLEKVLYDDIYGCRSFVSQNISMDSAIQRSGRTGRTCNGIVYRICDPSILIGQSMAISLFDSVPWTWIIKLIAHNIPVLDVLPFKPTDYKQYIHFLNTWGLIEINDADTVTVLPCAWQILTYPLPLWLSVAVYRISLTSSNSDVYNMILVASVLVGCEGSSIYFIPREFRTNKVAYIKEHLTKFRRNTEIETYCHIFTTVLIENPVGTPMNQQYEWARDNSISFKCLKTAQSVYKNLLQIHPVAISSTDDMDSVYRILSEVLFYNFLDIHISDRGTGISYRSIQGQIYVDSFNTNNHIVDKISELNRNRERTEDDIKPLQKLCMLSHHRAGNKIFTTSFFPYKGDSASP